MLILILILVLAKECFALELEGFHYISDGIRQYLVLYIYSLKHL